jgi:hypothetical protein
MTIRTTDFDRLIVSRPANHGSARVTGGGVARAEDDWRGWAMPRSSSKPGPPVVGVAPAKANTRQDELVAQIRRLERRKPICRANRRKPSDRSNRNRSAAWGR